MSDSSHNDTQTPSTSNTTLPPIQPLQNPKFRHISQSAAKRQSVQLLGSIRDLQLHFSQGGSVEHRSGAGVGVNGLGGIAEGDENVPPGSSSVRSKGIRERRPWKEVHLPRIGLDQARREASGAIIRMKVIWDIGPSSAATIASSPTSARAAGWSPTTPNGRTRTRDTGSVLVDTAKIIRRVRDLSLATVTANQRKVSAPTVSSIKRPTAFSTPSRPSGMGLPRAVTYSSPVAQAQAQEADGLGDLRKAALEVLAELRVLEEKLRVSEQDEADVQELGTNSEGEEDRGSTALPTRSNEREALGQSTSSSGTRGTPEAVSAMTDDAWDGEEGYSINVLSTDQTEVKEIWEERIVLEQRKYRSMDTESERVEGVRQVVKRWMRVAEQLFGFKEVDARVDNWARDDWTGRERDQMRAFLLAHLPVAVQELIPVGSTPDWYESLLARLSDGYILIQVYNAVVASSPKAWGYISLEEVHDTLRRDNEEGDEAKMDKEWTFRRTGNLTCWAAALRLRYNLPISMPTTTVLPTAPAPPTETAFPALATPARPARRVSPSSAQLRPPTSRQSSAQRIDFDPSVVAKRADGWEEMLAMLLSRWMEEAVRETRESEVSEAGEARDGV